MNIETSKILGGIGALLIFLGVFPYINYFGVIDIIGVILLLAGLYGFASYYKESGIFNNSLYGIIAGIVGVVLAAAIGIAIVLPNVKDFIMKIYPSWDGSWSSISSLSSMTPNTSNISFSDIAPFIAAALIVFVILWVFAIIASFLVRRSLVQVSSKTNVRLFSTAGLLLLIGAVLIIAFGIGVILMWIAVLLVAIAFFTMKIQPQQPTLATPPPPTTA